MKDDENKAKKTAEWGNPQKNGAGDADRRFFSDLPSICKGGERGYGGNPHDAGTGRKISG